MQYYGEDEILCCAQHVEAKRLANKFRTQHTNLVMRLPEELKLLPKINKLQEQFTQIRKGLLKCCDVI